jgi:hypothetical protein
VSTLDLIVVVLLSFSGGAIATVFILALLRANGDADRMHP